jgi:hypothetical protein
MKKNQLRFFALLFSATSIPTSSHAQSHLLLSEIGLAPAGCEFVEIYNPTNAAISLDNYYLADNSHYATLPAATPNLDAGDFIVRFPAGSAIQPKALLVIALNGMEFNTLLSATADFEVVASSAAADMLTIAVNTVATFTNTGEGVVLFYWDGASDLVKDVDIMEVGTPTAANKISLKTGLAVDGPDSDAVTSTYLYDFGSLPPQKSTPGAGVTTKRIALETDFENGTGGNGIGGHDETSEVTWFTWDSIFSAPDPDTLAIIGNQLGIQELPDICSIFPNPFTDHITFQNSSTEPTTLVIYDLLAHKILERHFITETTWNTTQLSDKIYFYALRNSSGTIQTGKLLKIR